MLAQNKYKSLWQFIVHHKLTIIYGILISYTVSLAGIFLTGYFNLPTSINLFNKYIIVFLCFIAMLIKLARNILDLKNPGLFCFILFVTYAFFRSIYYMDPLFEIFVLIKYYFLFLLIINIFENDEDYIILGACFVFLTTLMLVLYVTKYDVQLIKSLHKRLVSEQYFYDINANTISYLAVLVVIVYNYVIKDNKKWWVFLVNACLITFVCYIIMINASRGAL